MIGDQELGEFTVSLFNCHQQKVSLIDIHRSIIGRAGPYALQPAVQQQQQLL
jgi:hypothetical protein